MIVSTTPTLEGKRIIEYKGIVFSEVVAGVNFIKDFKAGFNNFFGGRSGSYEGELSASRDNALNEMRQKARILGANAVVGVRLDYEVISNQGSNMMMVIASGTAVIVE